MTADDFFPMHSGLEKSGINIGTIFIFTIQEI